MLPNGTCNNVFFLVLYVNVLKHAYFRCLLLIRLISLYPNTCNKFISQVIPKHMK